MTIDNPLRSEIPEGFKLRRTLRGHQDMISSVAWSPDGKFLASASWNYAVNIWDGETGEIIRVLEGHSLDVNSLSWSPDGEFLASGSADNTIRIWQGGTGEVIQILGGHTGSVFSLSWSPDGKFLASGSADNTVRVWYRGSRELLSTLEGHFNNIYALSWSPDGKILASGSEDQTIKLWNVQTGSLYKSLPNHSNWVLSLCWLPEGEFLASGAFDSTIRIWDTKSWREVKVIEGHTDAVESLSCSSSGRLIASKSFDGTVRIWERESWTEVAILDEPASPSNWINRIAFHPKLPILATLGKENISIRLWELDENSLLNTRSDSYNQYANAKAILVGDTGVGKTALGTALMGMPFSDEGSTTGRNVWSFDNRVVDLDNERRETRETLLWDLAGQPGYRLVHQLSLNEAAVALVVFDSRSETSPFAGVNHWERALRTAQRIQGDSAIPMKKYLIAARVDAGGTPVSQQRIDDFIEEHGFDGYYETSAKEGWGVDELAEVIRNSIDWDSLPRVSSTELFEKIKAFLIAQKESGSLIATVGDLYHAFMATEDAPSDKADFRPEFETCIGRVEARGLIRRPSFGNLVLLQPEILDAYASAIVNAARDEPDGLGSLAEEDVKAVGFRIPEGDRIQDREDERLLLIATIEEMLRHEIALREDADLVFPTQLTRENPELPDPEGKAVIFNFEGPVNNVYATLAVRLSRSGFFRRKDMWRNAITYSARVQGTYGMFMREIEEGRGELTLFFEDDAGEETRFQFEDYVHAHLTRRSLGDSLTRRRIFVCTDPECGVSLSDHHVQLRRKRGLDTMNCPVCDTSVSILDQEERVAASRASVVAEMDSSADAGRDRDTAQSILQGKMETNDFDVFLCHNNEDKPNVRAIGERLKERGILPWLDEWNLIPGRPWQRALEEQIENIKSVAVFIGERGRGPWQDMELDGFLREFVRRDCPVIPVLMEDASTEPDLPIFLSGFTWVDFRLDEPDPLDRLIWGITGERGQGRLLG